MSMRDRSVTSAPWFLPRRFGHRYMMRTSGRYRALDADMAAHEKRFRPDPDWGPPEKSDEELLAEAAIWRRYGEVKLADLLESAATSIK